MRSVTCPAAISIRRSPSVLPPPGASNGRTSPRTSSRRCSPPSLPRLTLWVVAINHKGTTKDSLAAGGFAANGYGDHSPGHYNLLRRAGHRDRAHRSLPHRDHGHHRQASVEGLRRACHRTCSHAHPPRQHPGHQHIGESRAGSTGPAIMLAFGGEWWGLRQLWLFWLAPIVGGILGAFAYQFGSLTATPFLTPPSWASPRVARRTPRANRDRCVSSSDLVTHVLDIENVGDQIAALRSGAGDLPLVEGLDEVAGLEVLEVGQPDAALEALADLADVVLEPLAAT